MQERLYAKAIRLAPGDYDKAAARIAGERAEYEAFEVEQVCVLIACRCGCCQHHFLMSPCVLTYM